VYFLFNSEKKVPKKAPPLRPIAPLAQGLALLRVWHSYIWLGWRWFFRLLGGLLLSLYLSR
jgi:hypothetical protein